MTSFALDPFAQTIAEVAAATLDHSNATLVAFDIELDWARHRIRRGSHEVHLSVLDVRLLRFLMTEPSRVFSREEILREVWPLGIHVGARTVDVHMAALRKALHVPDQPDPVRTVRGRGYALDFILDCGEAGMVPQVT